MKNKENNNNVLIKNHESMYLMSCVAMERVILV